MEASAIHAPAAIGRLPLGGPLLRLRSDEQLLAMFRSATTRPSASCTTATASACSPTCARCCPLARARTPRTCCRTSSCAPTAALRNDNREMNVRAWLYRVAHNRCIDHLRRPIPPPAEIFEVSRKPLHDPVEEAQRRDDLRQLVADVGQPARAAALRAADARDRRHDLRRPRGRAGRHRPRGQVAARPRAGRPRRGRRGARRRLRRDPRRPDARLRPWRQGLRAGAQAHALVRRLHASTAAPCAACGARSRRSPPASARSPSRRS